MPGVEKQLPTILIHSLKLLETECSSHRIQRLNVYLIIYG